MKVIFLDIDGVLVIRSSDGLSLTRHENKTPHPDCVRRLNEITDATCASIVVSSTWRLAYTTWELLGWFSYYGIAGKVIGVTPNSRRPPEPGSTIWTEMVRGHEIRDWMAKHGDSVESAVIIDDDPNAALGHEIEILQTEFHSGITDEVRDRAIWILMGRQERIAEAKCNGDSAGVRGRRRVEPLKTPLKQALQHEAEAGPQASLSRDRARPHNLDSPSRIDRESNDVVDSVGRLQPGHPAGRV